MARGDTPRLGFEIVIGAAAILADARCLRVDGLLKGWRRDSASRKSDDFQRRPAEPGGS